MKSSRNYFDYIVVGTGLSSYPAVYELLKKKKNFAVLDVGIDISKKMSSFYHDKTWKQISENKSRIIKKLNYLQGLNKTSKLSYGSNHSYSSFKKKFSKFESRSLGGFSNNWGSVLYIYNKNEIRNIFVIFLVILFITLLDIFSFALIVPVFNFIFLNKIPNIDILNNLENNNLNLDSFYKIFILLVFLIVFF
jgi:hypothetical protein